MSWKQYKQKTYYSADNFNSNISYSNNNVHYDSTVMNNQTINDVLYVYGPSKLNSTLDVYDSTVLQSTLSVNGYTSFNNSVDINGPLVINNITSSNYYDNGSLIVRGGAGISGRLNIGDDFNIYNNNNPTFTVLSSSGNTTITGTLDVQDTTVTNLYVNYPSIGGKIIFDSISSSSTINKIDLCNNTYGFSIDNDLEAQNFELQYISLSNHAFYYQNSNIGAYIEQNKLGIGTKPQYNLHVIGNTLITDDTTINTNLTIDNHLTVSNNTYLNNNVFFNNQSTYDTSNVRIGIGTTQPSADLHIYKSTPNITLQNTLTDDADINILFQNTNFKWNSYVNSINQFNISSNDSSKFTINADGSTYINGKLGINIMETLMDIN